MSIRHAILGLLSEQPMHGYKLKAAFDGRVSPLWGLTTGQIYQSLGALERAGLLESRGERAGRRPTRRIYSVTEAGKRELHSWLRSAPLGWERSFREDVLIRLMLLQEAEAAVLWESLGRQEHEATSLLARVVHLREQHRRDQAEIDLFALFADGMAHHLHADLKHLQRCRQAVEAWSMARSVALPNAARMSPASDRPETVAGPPAPPRVRPSAPPITRLRKRGGGGSVRRPSPPRDTRAAAF